MNTKTVPSIQVAVDPANPGQFFACCGLLELADRLFGKAEGWFEGGRFLIATTGTLDEALRALVQDLPTEVTRLENGLEVKPLIAPLRLSLPGLTPVAYQLDAWMTIRVEKGAVVTAANPPWNFWSGQQTSARIWSALRGALQLQLGAAGGLASVDLFEQRVLLSGRFGFDPGAAWNALDVGFSPNEQKIDVASSPAVELLAAVGVQRFRPQPRDRSSFVYSTWGLPMPPCVAAAAASGVVAVAPASRYLGRVVSRGSYAALGYSTPFGGSDNE